MDQEALGRQAHLKGIQDVEDARLAVQSGADALIVSNHGGRQLDGAQSSIQALPAIVEAVGKQIEVHMDGGIRMGRTCSRPRALGAQGTTSAAPSCTGWGALGEEGVSRPSNHPQRAGPNHGFCGHTNIETVDQGILLPGTYPTA